MTDPAAPKRELQLSLDRVEELCAQLQRDLLDPWKQALVRGDPAPILRTSAPSFAGWPAIAPELPAVAPDSPHEPQGQSLDLAPADSSVTASDFAEWLLSAAGAGPRPHGRASLEIEGCDFSQDLESASLTVRLIRVPVPRTDGWRVSSEGHLRLEAGRSQGRWIAIRAAWLGGQRVATRVPGFVERTRPAGLVERTTARQRQHLQTFIDRRETLSISSLVALDYNRDGFPDLISTREEQDVVLFLNDGRGGFVPGALPLSPPRDAGRGLLWLDLDGDGLEELVPTRVAGYEGDAAWLDLWTREDGEWQRKPAALRFPNPAGQRRVSVQALVPIDAQGDGLVELFAPVYGNMNSRGPDYNTVLAHDGGFNPFFQNHGSLEFEEAAAASGLAGSQYTFVAYAFDFDGDGDEDLWEGNDFGPNILWSGDGQGSFRRTPNSPLVAGSTYTMGVTLADYDNSGAWSLYISNMSSPVGRRLAPWIPRVSGASRERVARIAAGNLSFRSDREWSEVDLGLDDARWAWGCVFFDLENDGDQDLVVTNGFTSHRDGELPDWDTWFWRQVGDDAGYLERGEPTQLVDDGGFVGSYAGYQHDRLYWQAGLGSGSFFDAAAVLGLDLDHDGRAVVPIDVDGDGDLDLAYQHLLGLRLFENRTNPGSFARVRLEGRAPATHALGAQVELFVDGRRQRDRVRLVEGFHSQVLRDIHFGLAGAQGIDRMVVRWPDGAENVFEELPVNRVLVVNQARGEIDIQALPRWSAGFSDASDTWPELEQRPAQRPFVLCCEQDPTPLLGTWSESVEWRPRPGPGAELRAATGELWRAFSELPAAADLEAWLSYASHPPGHPDVLVSTARELLAQRQVRPAQALLEEALEADREHPFAWEALGEAHYESRRHDEALAAYRKALELDPDYGLAHYNLGVVLAEGGALEAANDALLEAARLLPQRYEVRLAAGETAAMAGRGQVAREQLEQAAQLEPTRAAALVLLGKLCGLEGDYRASVEAFQRALEREPRNADARQGLQRARSLLQKTGG